MVEGTCTIFNYYSVLSQLHLFHSLARNCDFLFLSFIYIYIFQLSSICHMLFLICHVNYYKCGFYIFLLFNFVPFISSLPV